MQRVVLPSGEFSLEKKTQRPDPKHGPEAGSVGESALLIS